ncbi:MAG: Ig-like domain-containing protein, partial [Gammaproteobacteria bacterium]
MNKFLSLFTIVFVITSCGGGGGGGTSSPSIPSPSISLGGSSLNGNVGDTITINWSSTNTTSCSASGNWSGTKALSGSVDISLLPGDNTFTLQCSGEGGSSTESIVIFAFDLGLYQSQINVDEDQNYTGSIKANPNETLEQDLTYNITEQTSNGTLLLLQDANILYTPGSNFFGSDSFVYEVYSPDKNITVSVTINIVVNPVNDSPTISPVSPETLTKNDLLFDDSYTLRVAVADVDNELDSLLVDVQIAGGNAIPSTFTPDSEQLIPNIATGDLILDLTSVNEAGLQEAVVSVYDEEDSSSFKFTTWFIAEKNVVTISQNVDPEDDSVKEDKDYYVYYLSGNSESRGRTKYLFVGDSLAGQNDVSLYRRALLASVNFLNDSDASEFFSEDYFTVVSAEPVEPDGSTPASIRTGCYDFDENIYCIGEMDRSVFDVMLPNNSLVSVLTKISGRGVNQGSKNIQRIRNDDPERTRTTLMHELGHAHGYMGDEYRSDDDRDVSFYADLNINTSTEPQASNVKWRHHIEDTTNVLGQDVLVCYNYGDGSIGDWDDLGITVDQCGCFANIWGELQSDGSYPFLGKNEDCAGVGHFEGNY